MLAGGLRQKYIYIEQIRTSDSSPSVFAAFCVTDTPAALHLGILRYSLPSFFFFFFLVAASRGGKWALPFTFIP